MPELDDDDDQSIPQNQRDHIKALERDLKATKAQLEETSARATQAELLQRELMFLKAGVNPDEAKAKWFVKGYDGELTLEAIKSAATEAQILGATASAPTPPDRQQLAAHQQIAQASASASSPDAEAAYEAALRGARSPQDVVNISRQYGKPVWDGA